MPKMYNNNCLHCGVRYKGRGAIFCSNQCSGYYRTAQINKDGLTSQQRWNNKNKEKIKYANKKMINNNMTSKLFFLFNYNCAFGCGRNPKLIHHVDGENIHNSKNVNNDISNLLPLCNSCHRSLHIRAKKYINKLKGNL
jgi:hypothetical protein